MTRSLRKNTAIQVFSLESAARRKPVVAITQFVYSVSSALFCSELQIAESAKHKFSSKLLKKMLVNFE